MRLARALTVGLMPIALAGCLFKGDPARWLNPRPLLGGNSDPDSAVIQYVIIERTAGSDDINRRAWDRVDEQVLSCDTRSILEMAGLRVGTAGESPNGVLQQLIDDPRTAWGHRARSFALDRPAPLLLTGVIDHVEFPVYEANRELPRFSRGKVVLGFDMSVRSGADGKVLVKLVPRARFHDPSQILPADAGDRGTSTETFPSAGFEIAVYPSEYLVVGTDWYWQDTFGHAAFVGDTDDRQVQRLLIVRTARPKAGPAAVTNNQNQSPPIATQASAIRGSRP